jgi:hypothetical protein
MKINVQEREKANFPDKGKEFAGKAQMPEVLRGSLIRR